MIQVYLTRGLYSLFIIFLFYGCYSGFYIGQKKDDLELNIIDINSFILNNETELNALDKRMTLYVKEGYSRGKCCDIKGVVFNSVNESELLEVDSCYRNSRRIEKSKVRLSKKYSNQVVFLSDSMFQKKALQDTERKITFFYPHFYSSLIVCEVQIGSATGGYRVMYVLNNSEDEMKLVYRELGVVW